MTPPDNLIGTIELRPDAAVRDILDVNDGIDRVMGDRDLYARMLKRFRSDYGSTIVALRCALHGGERDQAHRMVHNLKGAAGMIGAHRLHKQACALEQAIRTQAQSEQGELDKLAPELDSVVQVLDLMLTIDLAQGQTLPVPTRPLLEDPALLAQLIDLLASGDGAAVDLLEASAASLRVILSETKFARVSAAANEFDFEGALRVLQHP
ncbi:MAG: Hpt domain-containing protein [Telluria sp.]